MSGRPAYWLCAGTRFSHLLQLPESGNGNFARLVRTASWGHIQEHWYWTRKILSALTSGASGDDDW